MRLHHVSLIVADTEKALAFYQGVLCLDIEPSRPDLGYPGAWLTVGDSAAPARLTPMDGGNAEGLKEQSLPASAALVHPCTAAAPARPAPAALVHPCTAQIHLLELPNPDPLDGRPAHGGRDRHLALETSDFAGLKAKLDHAGIPYTLSRSGRKALFCRDPDQNAVEIIAKTEA